ncbi:MAG: prepilin-type N-terminal cleavage/methylation domain-containing protein, partial [Elusimicrobiaceae bacterium]|nr:prepilin-type N-terminal cleavage/methylation domain-containing protein [Elusimicrobiaceae bacterium]
MRNNGYTLIEILTAIIIVTILVAMAVPLYEKT